MSRKRWRAGKAIRIADVARTCRRFDRDREPGPRESRQGQAENARSRDGGRAPQRIYAEQHGPEPAHSPHDDVLVVAPRLTNPVFAEILARRRRRAVGVRLRHHDRQSGQPAGARGPLCRPRPVPAIDGVLLMTGYIPENGAATWARRASDRGPVRRRSRTTASPCGRSGPRGLPQGGGLSRPLSAIAGSATFPGTPGTIIEARALWRLQRGHRGGGAEPGRFRALGGPFVFSTGVAAAEVLPAPWRSGRPGSSPPATRAPIGFVKTVRARGPCASRRMSR